MKQFYVLFLLAVIPATTLISSSARRDLSGIWTDRYSGIQLEIRHVRKGIKVRVRSYRGKRHWRTYYSMGRGIYDDCRGNYIYAAGRNQIEWRSQFKRRSLILRRHRGSHYTPYDSRGEYWTGGPSYERDDYLGDWYCSDYGLNLEIRTYQSGFRARRRGGDWIYYDREDNGNRFRDDRNNAYTFEGDNLIWRSRDGRRSYRFKRK